MAEKKKTEKKQTETKQEKKINSNEKVECINIYQALSLFQGENINPKKTGNAEFATKSGSKISFDYSPLDEVLAAVRPALAKYGLSLVFEADQTDREKIVCALYHETYQKKVLSWTRTGGFETNNSFDETEFDEAENAGAEKIHFKIIETNVIRTMGIKVRRSSSEMKDVGSDSTYARRYLAAEALGIASEEDKDIEAYEKKVEEANNIAKKEQEKSKKNGLYVYRNIQNKLDQDDLDEIKRQKKFVERQIAAFQNEGKTVIELDEEELQELLTYANSRIQALESENNEQETDEQN